MAATDESMIMIYRFIMLTIIAFVIFGISGLSYNYEVNLYDTDSMLITRTIVDCLAPEGVVDKSVLENEDLIEYCGFGENSEEGFLIMIELDEGGAVSDYDFGNKELEWVYNIYETGLASENIEAYRPGYFEGNFSLKVLDRTELKDADMKVGVVFQNE